MITRNFNQDLTGVAPAAMMQSAPKVAEKATEKLELFDMQALTELFKVSKRTLYNWRYQGILPMFEMGGKPYITAKALSQIIEKLEGGVQ